MNISLVKEKIYKYLGKKVKVKEYLGRNKYEAYDAVLTYMYPNMFILNKDNQIKTFTYSDLLIKNVIIN